MRPSQGKMNRANCRVVFKSGLLRAIKSGQVVRSTGSQLRSTIAAQTAKLLRQAVIEESNGMLKRAM